MAHSSQAFTEHLHELHNLIVELNFPPVAGERGILLQNARRVGCEHQDELLDLSVLFHLPFEGFVPELTVENSHSHPSELISISLELGVSVFHSAGSK